MRITNNILQRTTLTSIQRNMRAIQDATERAVSGTRIGVASDDPGAAGTVLHTNSQLRALDQYQRNIGAARSRLTAEETVLDQVTDLLSRARELAMREGGGVADEMTRGITKAEVDQLLETAIQLGNTRHDGLYLFGGDLADQPPIVVDNADGTVSVNDLSGERGAEIAAGQVIHTNHNAQQIFGVSGVIDSLRALSEALGANDGAAITAAGQAASSALDQIQTLLGDVGARMVRLDIADSNIEALDVNLRTFRSNLSEVDLEEALTELVGRQTALQAAFVATSRILQTTLTDYIR